MWNLRGLCDAQLGDVAAARDAYARATRLDARFKEAWANLAQLERDAGRGEAALDGFDAALALDAGYAHARHLKAACLYALGDVRCARAEAAKAPANHLECAQQRALCLHARGAFADADAAYARALGAGDGGGRAAGGGADDGGGAAIVGARAAPGEDARGNAYNVIGAAPALHHHAYLRALAR